MENFYSILIYMFMKERHEDKDIMNHERKHYVKSEINLYY